MSAAVQTEPCADCNTTDDQPRIDGVRFGFGGKLCKRCYNRFRNREKRAASECDRRESPKNSDIDLIDHQGMVWDIALKYRGRGLELDDLVQEGQFGLFRAREKFKPELGFKFITYATDWVEHFIQRALENQAKFIRVPVYIQQKVRKGDCPEAPGLTGKQRDALAAAIHVSSAKVARGSDLTAKDMSLADLAEDRVNDFPEEEDVYEVVRAILGLDSQHRRVLRMLYGLGGHPPMVGREIADRLGLTKQRVNQIKHEALGELRKRLATQSPERRAAG
jgi:RNA polymerase primary sigma factor